MASNDFKKSAKTHKAPTDFIWGIVNKAETTKQYTVDTFVKLAEAMYPGINFWWSSTNRVALDVAAPDLKTIFPQLVGVTEAEALKKMGKTVSVPEIKKCGGYQWEDNAWRKKANGAALKLAPKG